MKPTRLLILTLTFALLLTSAAGNIPASAQDDSHYFDATGHSVAGKFWRYLQANGGLASFGYPLSDEISEISTVDGKLYTVQYFERAEFELHPENQPPYDVLLTPLGTMRYQLKHPDGAADEQASKDEAITFAETGKTLGGPFRDYWQQHGGLTRFGYPVSNQFGEFSDLDGKFYTVQYFERAVMELHDEDLSTQFIALTQLGRLQYQRKYLIPPKLALVIPSTIGGKLAFDASGPIIAWHITASRNEPIHTYNLVSNENITLPHTVGTGSIAADWPLIIWRGSIPKDADTTYIGIVGINMATGEPLLPYRTDSYNTGATVFGQSVVWSDSSTKNSFIAEVNIARDLGGDEDHFSVSSEWADYSFILKQPAISDTYIVWADITGRYNEPTSVALYKHNRRTSVNEVYARFTIPYIQQFGYALYGSTLVLAKDDGLYLYNLDTDAVTKLTDQQTMQPSIQGDYIAWVSVGPQGCTGQCQIWGMRRSEGVPRPLTAAPGDQTHPVIDGDLLIYQDYQGIHVTDITKAFADN